MSTAMATATVLNFPIPPERWVLVGQSADWLAQARQALASQHHPLSHWRVARGLVQVVGPAGLQVAVQEALRRQAPHLWVVYEAGAISDIDGLLNQALPAAHLGCAVRINPEQAPFAALAQALQQPDGLAAEQWLLGGRRVWPVIGHPGADQAFMQTAEAAFQHWAREFLADNSHDELEAIYGTGDPQAPEQDQPTVDGPRPPLQAVDAQPLRATPWGVTALPMAAAGRGVAGPWKLSGVLDEQGGAILDEYELSARLEIYPGGEQAAMTVKLRLDHHRWRGRRNVVLELHARRRLPLLVRLGNVAQGLVRQGVVTLTTYCDADQALLEALQAGELRVTYDNPA